MCSSSWQRGCGVETEKLPGRTIPVTVSLPHCILVNTLALGDGPGSYNQIHTLCIHPHSNKMEAVLSPPMDPVAITPEPYIQKTETTLIVRCLDRVFKSVTALDASAGAALFTVTSKGMGSYSWRRNVRDAAEERPLFDLRHTGFGMINKWAVESPSGRQVATLQHIKYQGKERSDIDAVVLNELDKGNEVKVEMRQKDRSASSTYVNIGNACVAEILHTENNDVVKLNGRDRSVWKVKVASGLDLALVRSMTNRSMYLF